MIFHSKYVPKAHALLQVAGLSKDYRMGEEVIPVLREVQLQIDAGEMVAVMGPSGSGKTTLLFILGLLLAPSSGTYRFLGKDVLSLSRRDQAKFRCNQVGFVFQSCDLLEPSTVRANLEYPLMIAGVRGRERSARITEALSLVNLSHRLHHPANLLSGGERQRVAVARALVNMPRMILADEPTGQLDGTNGRSIMEYFQKITTERGIGMLVVTHNGDVAARCSRIFSLTNGILREQALSEISR